MDNFSVLEVEFENAGYKNKIYPVILYDQDEVILIDCGYPGFLPLIESAAEKKGIDISRLTKIVITHNDFDHVGAVAAFQKKYPHVKILSSIQEEPYISGKKRSLRLQQAESIYHLLPEEQKESAKKFQQTLEAVENVEIDLLLKDKDYFEWCGGIEIIATPGHMPGHISVYAKASKTLISGDAIVLENGELAIANPQYTLDMEEAKKSILKLLSYEIDRVICYHGGIFNKDIHSALRKIIMN